MADLQITGDAKPDSDPGDTLFTPGQDDDLGRYRGHGLAVYGFVLKTASPEGSAQPPKNFVFPVNPQSLEQDEEAAVNIVPTQGGGKYIENQGNIFKDIVISGTTGFIPAKVESKQVEKLNYGSLLPELTSPAAATSAEDRRTQWKKYTRTSGYAAFLELRSLFREYWGVHRTGTKDQREQTLLFFVNLKDGESWHVEPLSFRMTRSSKNPLCYEYTIRLRTIGRASASNSVPTDLSCHVKALGTDLFDTMVKLANDIRGFGNKLKTFVQSFTQDIQNGIASVASIGNAVADSLNSITDGITNVMTIPSSIVATGIAEVNNLLSAVSNIADLPAEFVESLTSMRIAFDTTAARGDLFVEQWNDKWNEAIANFNTTFGIGGDVSSQLSKGLVNQGFSEAHFNVGEDIQTFSTRVLGDPNRALEVIVLNNLKPPYFSYSSSIRLPGTLAPGDPVLVPSRGGVPVSSAINLDKLFPNPKTADDKSAATSYTLKGVMGGWRVDQWIGYLATIYYVDGTSEQRLVVSNTVDTLTFEEAITGSPADVVWFTVSFPTYSAQPIQGVQDSMGVDLLLDAEGDIDVDAGDIRLVGGVPNFEQAVRLKIEESPGDLKAHPWFGFNMGLGERATPDRVLNLYIDAEKTFLADPRISAIEGLSIVATKDVYNLKARLRLVGLHDRVYPLDSRL